MQADLDHAAGRAATAEDLRRALPSAPLPYLDGALANPHLGKTEVLALLLNRLAAERHLTQLARDGRFATEREIRRRIALHPATPPTAARQTLEHLEWKALADVAIAPTIHISVKRHADRLLAGRVAALSTGERASLARRASRHLIRCLLDSREEPVLQSLLGNGFVVETDVVQLAATPDIPCAILARLSKHPVWGRRRDVRWALVLNPHTPVDCALRVVDRLPAEDLSRLVAKPDEEVPRIVQVRASRILEDLETKNRAVKPRTVQ